MWVTGPPGHSLTLKTGPKQSVPIDPTQTEHTEVADEKTHAERYWSVEVSRLPQTGFPVTGISLHPVAPLTGECAGADGDKLELELVPEGPTNAVQMAHMYRQRGGDHRTFCSFANRSGYCRSAVTV